MSEEKPTGDLTANVGLKFLECVDVLDKIKRFKEENSKGITKHFYTVKNLQCGSFRSPSTPRLRSSKEQPRGNVLGDGSDIQAIHANILSAASHATLAKAVLPPLVSIKRKGILDEVAKSTERRQLGAPREIRTGPDAVLRKQLEPISMIFVEDPSAQALHKTKLRQQQLKSSHTQRQVGLIKAIRAGSSAGLSQPQSTDEHQMQGAADVTQSGKSSVLSWSDGHNMDLGKLKLVDAVQLELGMMHEDSLQDLSQLHASRGWRKTPQVFGAHTSRPVGYSTNTSFGVGGKHNDKHALRLNLFARRSFLKQVLESTQIVPPVGSKFTSSEVQQKQTQLFENVTGGHDYHLFEDFLNGFGGMVRLFGNFQVKEIFNFKEFPLEKFGQPPDPEKDILMRLEKSKMAMSRWIDSSGKVSWRPCLVEKYDKASSKFTINWTEGLGSTKQVSRLNIVLHDEDVAQFEEIKKRASALRCQHLLEQSIKEMLLSKGALANCRVYFSFDQFKKLIAKCNLNTTVSDSPEFTASLTQEILEEYALGLLRFFAFYKSCSSYEHFLDQLGKQGGHSIGYTYKNHHKYHERLQDYLISESTTTLYDVAFDKIIAPRHEAGLYLIEKPRLVATWGRSSEGIRKSVDEEDNEHEKLLNQAESLFFTSILNFGGYALASKQKSTVLKLARKSTSNQILLAEVPSDDSIEKQTLDLSLAMPTTNLGGSSPHTPPEPAADSIDVTQILPIQQIKQPVVYPSTLGAKNHISISRTITMATTITNKSMILPTMYSYVTVRNPNISPLISALAQSVAQSLPDPLDLHIGHIALCHSAITDIERIDVFASFGRASDNELPKAIMCIKWVQKDFNLLREEYLLLMDPPTDDKKMELAGRFQLLSKCLNQQLQVSVQKMLEHSASKLQHFLEKVALMIQIEREYQEQIDYLLCKETYILRCRGQIRYNLEPDHQEAVIHPRKLETYSSFRRRVALFMSYAGYFMDKIVGNDLKVQQRIFSNSQLFSISLGCLKIQQRSATKTSKKQDAAKRLRIRSQNRERIYSMQAFFDQKYDAVVKDIMNLTSTQGMQFSADEFKRFETAHVVLGMLNDMKCEFGVFEFKPSLAKIEKELKESIRQCLSLIKTIPRISPGKDLSPPDSSPTVIPASLPKVIFCLDSLLSDTYISLLAFMYTLQSFGHLMPSDKSLVHDELKQLIDNDTLDPLETEVHQLLKDKQTLEHVLYSSKEKSSPSHFTIGPFAVDCQDIVKVMLSNVEDCVKKVFEPHIYKKFDSLIANNKGIFQELRDRLLSPITDIERYIEMKRFVEGEELIAIINRIRNDIKLCRRLNKFEEETRFMSDMISNDYLESLSWVTELTHLQEVAHSRIKKALPHFKEELVRIQERLIKEFEQTKIMMKEFETYSEDQEAENYHLKARELNTALENYLLRAIDLNSKQEIIGVKKSNMDAIIQNEKLHFSKYLDLWSFIDTEWNIKHESWKKEPFYRLDKSEMSTVIGNGLALLRRLQEGFKDNEIVNKLVRTKQNEVSKFNKVLDVVKILKDPSFKDRHWDDLFQHIKESDNNDVLGLREGRPDLSKITLGQLMLANIVSFLPLLKMIEIKANMESDIELRIKRIRQSVETIVIKPTIFDLDGSGLSIIPRIREINIELNDHLSTCRNMLSNPDCPEELVKELRILTNLLTITTQALTHIHTVQQKLIRFSPIFKFKELERYLTRKDTTSQFLKLREEFKKVLGTLEEKKIGFFTELVTTDEDESKEGAKAGEFLNKLQSFNTSSDSISQSLTTFFKMIRLQSPRYFYTTDEQMLTLCSLIKFPRSFIGFITTLFRGLQVVSTGTIVEGGESDSVEITSVTNMIGEVMRFQKSSIIELGSNAELPLISIVKELERQTAGFLESERKNSLVSIANLHFDFGMIYHHWNDKHITLQTMNVCVQALFDLEVSMILRNLSTPNIISKMPSRTPVTKKSTSQFPADEQLSATNMLKTLRQRLQKSLFSFVQYPIRYLKGKLQDAGTVNKFNGYIMMIQGLIDSLDYLEQSEVQNFEDFAYQMIPKYSVTFENEVKVDPVTGAVVEDDLEKDITRSLRHPEVVRNEQYTGCYTTYTIIVEEYMIKRGQKLVMTMMGHSLDYKYEVLHVSRYTNPWPLMERVVFSLWLAMCTCPHVIMRGYKNQGKLETLRALNQRIASNYFECDMSFGTDISLVTQYIFGMISGGYWLVFKNMEKAPSEILSIMASFANEISQSVIAKRTKIRLNDQELLIMGSHLILCTYNISSLEASRKFEELSTNITDQFRVITIHSPNYHMIASSLISGVFDSESDKDSWVSKLLFFCKTYQQAEINSELNSEGRGAIMNEDEQTSLGDPKKLQKILTTDKEYLFAPPSGIEESSTISKLSEGIQTTEVVNPQQMPDMTLREIYNLISRSLVKYYKSIHLYYETFKEKDGTYRIDLQILQLNQERTGKFTYIFRAEVLAWLQNYNPSQIQTQAQRVLFDKLFGEDLTKLRSHMNPSLAAISNKDMLTKLLATFRDIEPKCNLPEDDKRILKLLEGYTDLYLSCESGRQLIVCGDSNTQKSTLIKLLGLLESELSNSKFCQYWLNLESLAEEDVFGNTKSPGILREILLQTNNINLEEKSTATKLKYLFENSTDLFYYAVDPRLNKDGKIKKSLDKQNSWIVVDANSSPANEIFAARINYLLRIFSNLYEMKEVNQFVGFSNRLKIVYEINSLASLEPSHVSDACVLYVRQGFITTEDRINQWGKELSKCHPFFKMIMPKVNEILISLLMPLIIELEEETKQPVNMPAFSYGQRLSFLNSILGYFEIFLNEFRKMYVSLGLFEARRNPDTDIALKKLSAGPQGKSNKPELFSFGSGMKLAQEAGVSMIGQQRSKKTALKREDDHISGLKTVQDIDDFERRKLEGLAVFCFVTAAYPQLFCEQHPLLRTVVDKAGTAYCSKRSINKNLFADGLFSMMADKKIGGLTVDFSHYLYDFTKGRWISWESVKIPNKVVVSSSFISDQLTKNELIRLNCQNSDAFFKAEASANEEVFTFISSVEKTLVPTSNMNHMRYMLDLLLNYRKHTLLMSDHQQGKSSFLGNCYFRELIEARQIITFNFVLQKGISSKIIQKQMEDNLLGMGRNLVRPPQDKRVIVWIDDLQMTNDGEKPESLVRSLQVQGGWFSSNKQTFIKIEECQFLMTFSGTEYNKEATRVNLNSLNPDVLSKCMLLKTHKMSIGELSTVFFDQVKSNVDPDPSSERDRLISRLFHQLAKVVFFNQDTLKILSCNSLVNLNLDSFNQLARSMSLVDWEELSDRPTDVLFAWYKTLMSFLSCDFNFQKAEFEIIMKEKHAKMDLIKTTHKSSMFQSSKNQRLSIKLNTAVLEQLQAQLSVQHGAQKPKSKIGSSGSLGAKNVLLRKSSRLSIIPLEQKKAADMHLIKEEDHEDVEDEELKSRRLRSSHKSGEFVTQKAVSKQREPRLNQISSVQGSPSLISVSEAVPPSNRQKSNTLSISKSQRHDSLSIHKVIEKHGLVLKVVEPETNTPRDRTNQIRPPPVDGDRKSVHSSAQISYKDPSQGVASPYGSSAQQQRKTRTGFEKSFTMTVEIGKKGSSEMKDFYTPKTDTKQLAKPLKAELKEQGRRLSSNILLTSKQKAPSESKRGSVDRVGSRPGSARQIQLPNKSQMIADEHSSGRSLEESNSEVSPIEVEDAAEYKSHLSANGSQRVLSEVDRDHKSGVGWARELLAGESPKSKQGGSQRSIGGKSASRSHMSDEDQSHLPSSRSSNQSDEETSEQNEAENSHEGGSVDEHFEDVGIAEGDQAAFHIDPLLPTNVFFRKFIEMTMNFKLPGKTRVEELARSSCFDNKFLFNQNLLKEMKDSKERKEDNDDHTFFVPDAQAEQELMEFFKSKLISFIRTQPDALLSLKLDGGNFPLFVHHFSMLSMSLLTDFQQLFISAVKSLHYAKAVVQFIGLTLGVQVDYIDLLAANCRIDESGNISKADAYEHLKDVIVSTFLDVWRLKKRIIIIHVPNTSVNLQNRKILDRVLELMSSMVMNTDSIQQHLGDHLREMVDSAKSDKLYQHYSDFELKFTIRNRFQAKTIFVILNDSTQTYMSDGGTEMASLASDQSNSVYMYMSEHFSKLTAKFTKLVVNGLKCLEPADTPMFFQPVLKIEEAEMDALCARHLNTELNFLRCVDLDKEYFSLVRPFTENVVLYKACRNAIRIRLSVLENESTNTDCIRDKNLIVQRIEKRKEVLALEIKEIESQIITKLSEKEGVVLQEQELRQRKDNWLGKKSDCRETIEKLHFSMAELIKEEGLYQDLKIGLQETLISIREFRDKDLVQGVNAGHFTRSKSFAVYSIIFCELAKQVVVNKLSEEELLAINETTIDRTRVQDYISVFESTIANFGTKFCDAIGSLSATSISERQCRYFCNLVENMRVGIEDPSIVSQMQRAVLRVIDTCIEGIRLEQEKERRESEMQQLKDSISMLESQVDRCSSFLALIEKELSEQPELINKIDSRMEQLKKLKLTDLNHIQMLSNIVQNLTKYQTDFERVTQPLLSTNLNKDELADILSGLVAIYSKYPFEIKKKLLFTSMQSTSLPVDVFDIFPPNELLSSDPLVLDIMRLKVPCNTNFLINISILDLLQEEQTLPFPLILDQAKLLLRFLTAKNPKSLVVERLSPGSHTQEQLESMLRAGGTFVALDPDDEHMRLLRPIIDWQFRRFSENIILNNQQQIETTDNIGFFGKKITVNKQFYLYVILEGMHVSKIEQSILSKLLVLDNSVMSETGFCETLGDELTTTLDSLARGFQLSEYTSSNIVNAVSLQYKLLLQKGKTFDFLRDGLDSSGFYVFQNETSKFERAVRDYDKNKEDMKIAVLEYQNIQKDLFKIVLPSIEDEREFHFLNCPFGYKIADYIKLSGKHLKFASLFWPYFYALHLMRSFLGDSFSVGYDLISHMVKQNLMSLEIRHQLPADQEKRQEVLPALFNEAERQVYFSLKNCFPGRFQSIFSFLLSVITLQRRYTIGTSNFRRLSVMPMSTNVNMNTQIHLQMAPPNSTPSNKQKSWTTIMGLSQLLNQFLWSERVLGRNARLVSFSTGLYTKFNNVVLALGGYYQDTQELLPMLLPRTQESCKLLSELTEQVDGTYKQAVDAYRDADVQEKLLSQLIDMQFTKGQEAESYSSDRENSTESPVYTEPGSPVLKRFHSGAVEVKKTELGFKLNRAQSFEVPTGLSQTSVPKFNMPGPEPEVVRTYLRDLVPFYSAEGIARQLATELDFLFCDMRPKEFGGQKISFDQVVLALKTSLSNIPQRTTLKLQIHSTGDPVYCLMQGIPHASPLPGVEAERRASKLLLQPNSGSKKKNPLQSLFFAGLSQASAQNKLTNLNLDSRKSLKNFAKIIVEKNKAQKAAGQDFAQMFVDYIQEILSKVFGFNIKFSPEDMDWNQFLVGSRLPRGQTNPENHDPECPPLLPELPRQVSSWHLMGRLAVVKYARPDWIESFLTHSYSEIRGKDYLYCQPTLDHIYMASTSKRCSVILYQRIDRSPVLTLERLAAKTGAKVLMMMNALRISLDEFVTNIDTANKRANWVIVENLHLVSFKQSTLMIKEAQAIIDKSASSGFRIWLLYKIEKKYLQIGSSGQTSLLPPWLSSCQYIFLDEAESVREELRHLFYQDFSNYSVNLNAELSQNLSKMSFNDMIFGKSDLAVEVPIPLIGDQPSKPRMGTLSSPSEEVMMIGGKGTIQKPRILVQLPSDFIAGQQNSIKASPGLASPVLPKYLSGSSTTKAGGITNPSRFGQQIGQKTTIAPGMVSAASNLNILIPEPATPIKSPVSSPTSAPALTRKRLHTDVITGVIKSNPIQNTAFTNTQITKRCTVVLKLVSAVFRQRRKCVADLLGEESTAWLEFSLPKDRQLDQIFSCIIDLATGNHSKDIMLTACRAYIHSFFGDTSRLNDATSSPLLALQFLKGFLLDSPPRADIKLEYSASRPYTIPSMYSSEIPGKILTENLLSLPIEDSPILLGFRQNEQALIDFNRSKKCFAFLLRNIGNRLDLQVPTTNPEYQGTNDPTQAYPPRNSSAVLDVPTGDAALTINDPEELCFLSRFIKDNKKHSRNIVGRFFLNHIEYGYNLILNHEFQGELKSDLRNLLNSVLTTLSDPMISSIQRIVDMQNSQDQVKKHSATEMNQSSMGKVAVIGPGIAKSSSRLPSTPSPFTPEEILEKIGYKQNNQGKMYLVLNTQEQIIRGKGRRYLVSREWNLLAMVLTYIKQELQLALMSLLGDAPQRKTEHARKLVEDISANKVPMCWHEKVRSANITTDTFKSMIQSLLLRIDSLYSLAIDSHPKLPPIIHLGRLVSPEGFFLQILQFNSQLHNVSMIESVVMLFREQSDKHKIYNHSTSWTIRGLKVRGGKVDEESKLVPEDQGEYEADIGPLHLEITQFPKSQWRRLEGEPHIPLVFNTDYEDEADPEQGLSSTLRKWILQGDYFDPLVESRGSKEQLDYMAAALCPGILRRQPPQASETASGAQTSRVRHSIVGGFSALAVPPKIRDFGQILKGNAPPYAQTLSRGSMLGIPQKQEEVKPTEFKVRLPLQLSFSYNPLTQMRFYVYFKSPRPQEYWISRGSVVKFSE